MNDLLERIARLSPAKRDLLLEKMSQAGLASDGALNQNRLVAYVTGPVAALPSNAELREFLAEQLPSAMIPTVFVPLERLPLTPSGKVDRHALPEPPQALATHLARPPDTIEELLAGIWSKLLGGVQPKPSDSFFDLGGHSLLAIQLVARVRDTFQVEVPLGTVFEAATLESFAAQIRRLRDSDKRPLPEVTPSPREGDQPASFAQERMWVMEQLEPGTAAYHVNAAVRLRGSLDRAALHASLAELQRRHHVLQSAFVSSPQGPLVRIHPEVPVPLEEESLEGLASGELERELMQRAEHEAKRPFALDHPPLWRARLLRIGAQDQVVILVFHHTVMDGWSMGVVAQELAALYDGFRRKGGASLAPPLLQYSDYAHWQRSNLEGERLEEQLRYWREALKDAPMQLELPCDHPRPTRQTFRGKRVSFDLDAHQTEALRTVAREERVTLFMVLLAGFQTLLARLSGQRDVVVGVPNAGRVRAELEPLVGLFVNSLPLRGDLRSDLTFRELLASTRAATLGAQAHQETPFERVVDALKVPRDLSRSPIFQVMFALQNTPMPSLQLEGLSAEPLDVDFGAAQFDLTLFVTEVDSSLEGWLEYNEELFDASTAVRMAAELSTLLERLTQSPEKSVFAHSLLSSKEEQQAATATAPVENSWNQRDTVLDVFARMAQEHADSVAVSGRGTQLSYRELAEKSDARAATLSSRGLRRGDVVALVLDRSADFLISMFAIWKAGGAFLPVDPAQPIERLRAMLTQASCAAILTEPKHAAIAHVLAGEQIKLVLEVSEADPRAAAFTRARLEPGDLAYVIFTSGSTGVPKGAMIEHLGMLNHLRTKADDLGLKTGDAVAQIAAATFDVSVWQFLSALLVGAKTGVFADDAAWEPTQLLAGMARERITVVETVPTHLNLILDELESRPDSYDLSGLRWMILNGEPLLRVQCARWFKLYPGIPILNAYGATETSDDNTHFKILALSEQLPDAMPIQGALPNQQVLVLDERLQRVPPGVIGELYVGGVGVGRGYVGAPEKTALAFVPNPFSSQPGARLYRTGDRAKMSAKGVLELVGRTNQQVKIRGFRIETGEVEAALLKHPHVREAVVVARELQGEKQLVAYVTKQVAQAVTPAELAAFLQTALPSHMVPSSFVLLAELPLLSNGKVARQALPAPTERDRTSVTPTLEHAPPATSTERHVARLWEELLELQQIGRSTNFFEVGGHSLLAIRSCARVRAELGVELPVRVLFEAQTLEKVARAIDAELARSSLRALPSGESDIGARRSATLAGLQKVPKREHYPLAAYQLPEWYLHELEPDSPFYNISFTNTLLTGTLDLDAFVGAWNDLVERHVALRIHFDVVDGRPVQRVKETVSVRREDVYLDMRGVTEPDFHAEVDRLAHEYSARSLDFRNGPMFVFRVAEFSQNRFLFLLLVHHILWDEMSTMNMAQELSELYNARLARRAPKLPELALDYLDFSVWIEQAIASGQLESQRQYWLKTFADLPPPLQLVTDRPRPRLQTFNGGDVGALLPRSTYERVEALVRREHITLNIFLHSVLNLQLHLLSGQHDFVVGTPMANRDDERLDPVLGLFATALPIRCNVLAGDTFLDLMRRTRDSAVEAYDHHNYPSVLAIQELAPVMDLSRNRLFSVMYGLQNNKNRLAEKIRFDGLELTFLEDVEEAESETAKFDLTYVADFVGEELLVRVNYNSDLFDRSTGERMLRQYFALLEQVTHSPAERLTEFSLTSPIERQELIVGSRAEREPIPGPPCIHPCFEVYAHAHPDAVALELGDVKISYGDLDARSSAWARALVSHGVVRGSRVGIAVGPGVEQVVAVLAVLKAGAAYVPVSADQPLDRRTDIFRRAGVELVLTQGALGERLPPEFRGLDVAGAAPAADPFPIIPLTGADLAYVLFTSGTTGEPRGIEVTHAGIPNLVQATQLKHALSPKDAVLFITPLTFDASILDLFWPLSVGARVVLPREEDVRSPTRIAALVDLHRVSVLQCVPLMLSELIDARTEQRISGLDSLRTLICGGAFLSRELKARFQSTFRCGLYNHYGPTEVTVDATSFDCREDTVFDIVPIGRPISGTHTYVLDAQLRLVPAGVIGELFVSSPGLARGYLGEAGLTAARFWPNPFSQVPGERMYATGDLVFHDRNGVLHFVGRADRQVKIRGNRVELEEVESRLQAHPYVARSAVRRERGPRGDERLSALVELKLSACEVQESSARYRLFTLEQRPDLAAAVDALHQQSWPEYFTGNASLKESWPRLTRELPQLQYALVDEEDRLVAAGNAVALRWNGQREALPSGWDEALVRGLEVQGPGAPAPDTYCILTGIAARGAQGKGLSEIILKAFKSLARELGFARMIVAVRPIGKAAHPELSFAQWCSARRPDGQLEDGWLRIHERVGGKILGLAPCSQRIVAPLEAWERWAGRTFSVSGDYAVRETLQPVHIDVERRLGEYFEPAVWIEHFPLVGSCYRWPQVSPAILKSFLRAHLPEYAVPERIRVVGRIPLTPAGKVDERALRWALPQAEAKQRSAPLSGTVQHRLGAIWSGVLGVADVGADDDFFLLGGHSIRAVEMLVRVTEAFGVSIPLRALFQNPTIRGLEALLTS